MKCFVAAVVQLTVLLFFSSVSEAKWSKPEEAQEEVLLLKTNIKVANDGSYKELMEFQVKILTEDARAYYLRSPFAFFKSFQKWKLLKATVTTEGQTTEVDDVEIKDVDSGGTAFDDKSIARVTFPRMKIGSVIYLKTERLSGSILEGAFGYGDCLSGTSRYKSYEVNIDSKIPLKVNTYGIPGYLKIKSRKRKGQTRVTVRLKKPYYRSLMKEDYSYFDKAPSACYSVSIPNAFAKMGPHYSKEYSKVYQQKLPSLYQSLIAKEKKDTPSFEQIDRLMEGLRRNIKYLGDWRTRKGKFLPRDLAEVAKSGYGDCKDYATGLTAMLRHLGYEAYPALIFRDYNHHRKEKALPGPRSFNHVITAVQMKGRTHFVDPTNQIVQSRYIYQDIDQRRVLVLDGRSKRAKQTPEHSPESGSTRVDQYLDFSRKKNRNGELHVALQGYHAKEHTEWMMRYQYDPSIVLMNIYGDATYMQNPSHRSGPIRKDSAILKDLKFTIGFEQIPVTVRTPFGKLFRPLVSGTIRPFLVSTQERYSGVRLIMGRFFLNYHLKGVKFKGDYQSLQCEIKSPWIRAKRQLMVEGDQSRVLDDIHVLKKSVNPEEMKTDRFEKLQVQLRNCFVGSALIF